MYELPAAADRNTHRLDDHRQYARQPTALTRPLFPSPHHLPLRFFIPNQRYVSGRRRDQ